MLKEVQRARTPAAVSRGAAERLMAVVSQDPRRVASTPWEGLGVLRLVVVVTNQKDRSSSAARRAAEAMSRTSEAARPAACRAAAERRVEAVT